MITRSELAAFGVSAAVFAGLILVAIVMGRPPDPSVREFVFPSILLLQDLGFIVSAVAFVSMAITLMSDRRFRAEVPAAFAWLGGLFFLFSAGLVYVSDPLSRRLWLFALVTTVAVITYSLAWCQMSWRARFLTRDYDSDNDESEGLQPTRR
jgi:hypothetical protein